MPEKQFAFHVEVEQKKEEKNLTFFEKVFETRLKCKLSNSHTTDCIFVALVYFRKRKEKRKIQKSVSFIAEKESVLLLDSLKISIKSMMDLPKNIRPTDPFSITFKRKRKQPYLNIVYAFNY